MTSTTLSQSSISNTDNNAGFSFGGFLPRSIAAKLSLISIVAIVVMLIFGGLLFFTQNTLTNVLETTIILNQAAQRAESLQRSLEQTTEDLSAVLDNDQTDLIAEILADNEALLAGFSAYRSEAEEFNLTADINFTIEHSSVFNNVRQDIFTSLTLYRDGSFEASQEIRDDADRNIIVLANGFERSAIQRAFLVTEELELATNLQTQLSIITFVILAIGTVLLVSMTFVITRSINNNIKQLQTTASEFEAGNYSERAAINSRDEVGELAHSFNAMAQSVQNREVDMKKAQKEAQAFARIAAENSRLKSDFLSTMSHELRTPMNAIEGFTGIMLNHMAGTEYNDKSERYLNKIRNNSRRLLGLINDFLDLSRIESGRLELAYSPMSPYVMAQRWQDNLSVLAQENGLDLQVTVDSNLPETLYGDEESISKIAINLLGNAMKFTDEGSVSLNLEKRGEQMALEVRDTGIGIPPHAREIVFEEFRQVDQSTTRKHGGTGLGLSIVQKLVRAMGGQIILDSEVGVGSTFTVLLPIHTDEKQAVA